MAIKSIIAKGSIKHKICLCCGKQIEDRLEDDTVYFCENCGQEHYVDVYEKCIALTVKERPDLRRRHRGNDTEAKQQRAREALIRKTEGWRYSSTLINSDKGQDESPSGLQTAGAMPYVIYKCKIII